MKTKTRNMLWRIYAYAITGFIISGIVSMVFITKSVHRQSDIFQAERQMYGADRVVHHVDMSLYLCQNVGYIPYPLNYYLTKDSREIMKPFTPPMPER